MNSAHTFQKRAVQISVWTPPGGIRRCGLGEAVSRWIVGSLVAITTEEPRAPQTNIVIPWLMPRTTAKKPPSKPRPKKAKPTTSAAQTEAERPAVRATGYTAGEFVSHPMFGPGTVTAVEADKLTIKFADGQIKQIVYYYVNRRTR
jgi:hypothetical protein